MEKSQAGLSQRQRAENLEIPLSIVNRVLMQFNSEGRKALHHAQVIHRQLRGLSMLSRALWNKILQQLRLTWSKWLRRTQELLSTISMPLDIAVELLEGSHFFTFQHWVLKAMRIRDDKQASEALGYCCLLWWVPVCTVFWQRSNLGLVVSIPRVSFAASAADSLVWWLFSYGLGYHLDSWTFWACGLWWKCQC